MCSIQDRENIISTPSCSYVKGAVLFKDSCVSKYNLDSIEEFVRVILDEDYHIDMTNDGILVYWVVGVCIDYFKLMGICDTTHNRKIKIVVSACITTVIKVCHDETWHSYSSYMYDLIKDDYTFDELIAVEIDIICKVSIIDSFKRYCPEGYMLQKMSLFKYLL